MDILKHYLNGLTKIDACFTFRASSPSYCSFFGFVWVANGLT